MAPLRAHVHNGRLVLDEPTDLPEGEVVELVPMSAAHPPDGDDLDDAERERLHASIARGMDDVKLGRVVPAGQIVDELRARATRRG